MSIESASNIVSSISNFLSNNQIRINNQTIYVPFEGEVKTEMELMKGIKIAVNIRSVNHKLYVSAARNNDSCHPYEGPIKKGSIFRISPKGQISFPKKTKITTQIKNYICYRYPQFKKKLFGKCYDSKWRILKRINLFGYQKYHLESCEGVTFSIAELKRRRENYYVSVQCIDHGGIYDQYLNSEGKYYPPQVPGNYYADTYAAYIFLIMFIETKNKSWLLSCEKAIDFICRHYRKGYPGNIVWHHSDFKNPLIIELYKKLSHQNISPKSTQKLRELISKLCEDFYSPTNVYCLRVHWHCLLNSIINKKKYIKKIKKYILRIKIDQTEEGLIMDNYYPMYSGIYDLTYHNYSLACLIRAYESCGKGETRKEIMEIIEKAAVYSFNIQTRSGEVSYIGRGANNVYHLAACFYAFAFMYKYFKKIDSKKALEHLKAAYKIVKYIQPYMKKEEFLPTCLNDYLHERMGWNHCETPYNALSVYFIKLGLNYFDINTPKNSEQLNDNNNSKIFYTKNLFIYKKKYEVAIFRGGKRSYYYSDGAHRSGIAGIAVLSKKRRALIPILDETKNGEFICSDIPFIKVGKTICTFLSPGELIVNTKEDDAIKAELILKNEFINVKKTYICIAEFIEITLEIRIIKSFEGSIYPINIPMKYGMEAHIEKNNIVITESDEVYSYKFEKILNSSKSEIFSNPRGKAFLLKINKDSKKFKKNEVMNFRYKIYLY